MSEDHQIVSQTQGEALPEGCTGVRVRVQLSGCPTRRWSRDLAARLSRELVGHAAVGHLRLNVNDLVHADQIVLEGVAAREAPVLGGALERAVNATNRPSAPRLLSAASVRDGGAVVRRDRRFQRLNVETLKGHWPPRWQPVEGQRVVVQSWAGRPLVRTRWLVALPS
jgi:hypothetical protein